MLVFRTVLIIIFSSIIYEGIQVFRSQNYHKVFIENSSQHTDHKLSDFFKDNLTPDGITHFIKGAHIVLQDNGELFKHLKEQVGLDELRSRPSLHYNILSKQYAFSIEEVNIPEVLFGETVIDGLKVSWIQAERRACKGIIQNYWHAVDALIYLFCAKKINIGPFGFSKFTSSNPLFIKPK